ncbi:MAG: hypothetical protein LBP19_06615 [Treponema sp.]|nr:hypothetical protein [Treponema sp.]
MRGKILDVRCPSETAVYETRSPCREGLGNGVEWNRTIGGLATHGMLEYQKWRTVEKYTPKYSGWKNTYRQFFAGGTAVCGKE